MAKFISSPSWKELDFSYRVKNFSYNRSSEATPLSLQKFGFESLAATINHLAAYQPKIIYSQSWPQDYHYYGDANPLIQFCHYDYNTNGREYKVEMTTNFRANNDAYFFKFQDADYQTDKCTGEFWGPNWVHLTFDYVRGDSVNDVINDGISQVSDFELELWDIVVQEKPIEVLDSEVHTCVVPGNTRDHTTLTVTEVEAMRSTLHELRTRNLPMVIRWSALTTLECSTTQASQATGICITSNTLLNIWDLASTSRTATSPGTLFYAYRAARGNEDNNKNVKVIVRAYARVIDVDGSPSGTIRFQGPDHVASNYHELTVTSTSFDWIGGADSDFLYLNASVDYDDLTTGMNKIDILASVTASDKLQILGVFAWVCYE